MGTTTSSGTSGQNYQTTDDVNAILQGMTDASIDRGTAALPAQLRPGYQPPMPTALAPQQASTLPVPQPNQPNYTVGPVRPGDPGYQPQPPASWVSPVPDQSRPQGQPGQPGQIVPPNTDPRMPVQPPGNVINTPQPLTVSAPQQPPSQPRTGERPPVNSMPRLWNGGQVGPSGLTKQQFLTQRMMHESQGDPTALNYVARRDPRMYDRGYTAGGLLQDLNTTWANGVKWATADPERYPMIEDPRKFTRAMDAHWTTQWQVNSAIYDHAGEQPWKEKDGSFRGAPGMGEMRNQLDERTPTQQFMPAQPRHFGEWGRQPAGFGSSQPGAMPRQSDFGRIMTGLAPLLVGIGSLALRLPLSTAITAYGAMAKAQQNGQNIEYQRNRTHFQDQLKEATAQQTLESQAAGDAFAEYGNNNPQGLQQELAKIALQYNDPTMFRMAERGDLNGIHNLQTRRDMLNQNLVKTNKAVQDEQDQQAQNAAVAAMDRKYQQEHPDATQDDLAIAHNEHIGQASRAGTTRDPTAKPEQESEFRNVLDPDGKRTGQQVREGKTGGLFDLNGQPVKLKEGETLEQPSRSSSDNLSEPKAYDVVGDDGKVKRTVMARDRKDRPGLEDAETGEPITHGKDEHLVPHVAPKAGSDNLSEPKAYDVVGPDDKVRRTVMLRDRKDHPGFEDAETGEPFQHGSDERLVPHVAQRAGTGPHFGTVDDLMQRWHEQFVKDNNREPSTDEISHQRQTFTQESKPSPMSARQVSQRLGIAIGEAAGGVAALTQLSSGATLGPWGGAQASLTTGVYDNFLRSLTNRVTPEQAQMMNSIAKVIARPLASLEAAGVATGLVGVTQSLQTEFPQAGDSGYTVLTKLANIRNIVDAAEDMLARDKNLDPEIRKLIADNRAKVDVAIPYTLNDVVTAQVNPSKENMRGLAERLLHRTPTAPGQGSSGLPPGVTVEVK